MYPGGAKVIWCSWLWAKVVEHVGPLICSCFFRKLNENVFHSRHEVALPAESWRLSSYSRSREFVASLRLLGQNEDTCTVKAFATTSSFFYTGLETLTFLGQAKKRQDHVSCLSSHVSSKPQNLYREEAGNFLRSLSLHREPQPIWVESSEFFQVPEHLYEEKAMYDDSYLASLGTSLY